MNRYNIQRTLILLTIVCTCISGKAHAIDENIIKAAFIEKLTRFIEWPETDTPTDKPPFKLCIIGKSKIKDALHDLANNTDIKGRRLLISQITDLEEIDECNTLFIASTTSYNLNNILTHSRNQPILTIADSAGYARHGVMINFFYENQKLRFEINHAASKAAGIKVSARILKLARVISDN